MERPSETSQHWTFTDTRKDRGRRRLLSAMGTGKLLLHGGPRVGVTVRGFVRISILPSILRSNSTNSTWITLCSFSFQRRRYNSLGSRSLFPSLFDVGEHKEIAITLPSLDIVSISGYGFFSPSLTPDPFIITKVFFLFFFSFPGEIESKFYKLIK